MVPFEHVLSHYFLTVQCTYIMSNVFSQCIVKQYSSIVRHLKISLRSLQEYLYLKTVKQPKNKSKLKEEKIWKSRGKKLSLIFQEFGLCPVKVSIGHVSKSGHISIIQCVQWKFLLNTSRVHFSIHQSFTAYSGSLGVSTRGWGYM